MILRKDMVALGLTYRIHAQFTPTSLSDYADSKLGLSSFAGHQDIAVVKPDVPKPPQEIQHNIVSSVGGFLYIKRTQCNTEIIFDKKEYYADEEIRVRIHIDNS